MSNKLANVSICQKIIVLGDVHANFGRLNDFITKEKPDIILQCGDFGWWPHYHNITTTDERLFFNQYALNPKETKIFWCDGNHENHEDLQSRLKAGRKPLEIPVPGCFYMPRGSILRLDDGRNVLFFGGAYSIDKKYRQEGVSWWAEEIPTESDFIYAEEQIQMHGGKIEVVISHTAPTPFLDTFVTSEKIYDPSVEFLNRILEKYRPARWYFGHFHSFHEGEFEGCKWQALADMRAQDRWFAELSAGGVS